MAGRRLDLEPGEQLLVEMHPHWSFLAGPLVVALLVAAGGVALDVGFPDTSVVLHWVEGVVVAVPCLWLAGRVVRWRTTWVVLTSSRVVEEWGVGRRRFWSVPFERIASVTVVQSFFRRLVGTGRLELVFWEEHGVQWLDDVRKPAVVRRVIVRRLPPTPPVQPPPDGRR